MKLSPAVDLVWRVAVREAAGAARVSSRSIS